MKRYGLFDGTLYLFEELQSLNTSFSRNKKTMHDASIQLVCPFCIVICVSVVIAVVLVEFDSLIMNHPGNEKKNICFFSWHSTSIIYDKYLCFSVLHPTGVFEDCICYVCVAS